MSTVYTQRLMLASGDGGASVYTVPAGYRVIVRCITVYDGTSTTGRGVLWLGATPLVSRIPAAAQSVALELSFAAYAGEALSLTTYGASTSASATGYVFRDTEGPIGRDLSRQGELPEHASPLPGRISAAAARAAM